MARKDALLRLHSRLVARRDALRKAFDDTMKDKAFLEEAQKTDLEVQPVSGADVQALVADIYKSSPEVVKIAADAAKSASAQ